MIFSGVLVEILLSIVLMFNVGAYSFLWYKIRREEEDKDEIEEELQELRRSINDLWSRIYGSDEDQTMEGHLVETEERFDSIDTKLEELCQKMDKMKDERVAEHEEVREQMETIAKILHEEEQISVDRSDIIIDD